MKLVAAGFELALFAYQHAPLRAVTREFRERQKAPNTTGLVIAIAVVCAFFVAVWFLARVVLRSEPRKAPNNPARLFRQLCKAHGLDSASRRLLQQLATSQGLATSAALFVGPERFAPERLGPEWQSQADALKRLRDRLFGG